MPGTATASRRRSMARPDVSIIMPCYNAGRYIAAAIDSVMQQAVDYQLIVVDDGSTDDTSAVLQRYAGRLQVVSGDHAGVANARNKALPHLQGDYTLLLDADDALEPGALETLLRATGGKDIVAYGRFSSWDASMQDRLELHDTPRLRPSPFIFLSRGNFSPPGCMLFPGKAFDEVGGFDQAVAGCEDWDFLIRLARAGYRFQRVNKPVFNYRRHLGSASNQAYRMYRSGCEVVRRCFRADERVLHDRYPQGNRVDTLERNLLNYQASCFSLAVLVNDMDSAIRIMRELKFDQDTSLRAFGKCFKQGLWWYSITGMADRERLLQEAEHRAAGVIAQFVEDDARLIEAMKAILYPDFTQLLLRPGPKKALRLLREWRLARKVMHDSLQARAAGAEQ